MQIQMISKSTWDTQVVTKELKNLSLSESTVVLIDIRVENIEKIDYSHNKVIIFLNNGEQIIIENFNSEESSLLFRGEQSELFLFDFETISYNPIDKIEPLLYEQSDSSIINIWPWVGGAAGIGVLSAAVGSNGSSGSTSNSTIDTNEQAILDALAAVEKAEASHAAAIKDVDANTDGFISQSELDAVLNSPEWTQAQA
ncbi:BapA/Bap/LapF family prefix-like domain-containing protein, partial [Acinetobacter indicus]|uniref:BapA/Bap/LapF family prefix-like domain-containing protein n=1 Tax=Acinetobacter indicus TaxID=756892 RepID=UPI00396A26E2